MGWGEIVQCSAVLRLLLLELSCVLRPSNTGDAAQDLLWVYKIHASPLSISHTFLPPKHLKME